MDMSKSYKKAAETYLPGIPIVFDRFHVMQLINKAIDKVRKRTYSSLNDNEKQGLKKSRFLLLKNSDKMTTTELQGLNDVLDKYAPIGFMHMMKEQIRQLWNFTSKKHAQSFLFGWIITAIAIYYISGCEVLKPLKSLAMSLARHSQGILNYFNHPITNGRAEGINNKIKTLKRQAYGFRDNDYFKLRLYHLHVQKHRIAG